MGLVYLTYSSRVIQTAKGLTSGWQAEVKPWVVFWPEVHTQLWDPAPHTGTHQNWRELKDIWLASLCQKNYQVSGEPTHLVSNVRSGKWRWGKPAGLHSAVCWRTWCASRKESSTREPELSRSASLADPWAVCRLCSGKESALRFQTGGGLLWVVANTHILIVRLNAAR